MISRMLFQVVQAISNRNRFYFDLFFSASRLFASSLIFLIISGLSPIIRFSNISDLLSLSVPGPLFIALSFDFSAKKMMIAVITMTPINTG